jgi:hypothetical protein
MIAKDNPNLPNHVNSAIPTLTKCFFRGIMYTAEKKTLQLLGILSALLVIKKKYCNNETVNFIIAMRELTIVINIPGMHFTCEIP